MKNALKQLYKTVSFLRACLLHRMSIERFLHGTQREELAFSGSVKPDELVLLKEMVELSNSVDGPIVEFGTLFGFTTQKICTWKSAEKRFITCDNYSWNPFGFPPRLHQAMTERSLTYVIEKCHVELVRFSAIDFHREFSEIRPSLVFIDAGHQYEDVKKDIEWSLAVNAPLICGHDYGGPAVGVTRAVDEAFGSKVRTAGTLWAVDLRK
jgi:hypothetical protein